MSALSSFKAAASKLPSLDPFDHGLSHPQTPETRASFDIRASRMVRPTDPPRYLRRRGMQLTLVEDGSCGWDISCNSRVPGPSSRRVFVLELHDFLRADLRLPALRGDIGGSYGGHCVLMRVRS